MYGHVVCTTSGHDDHDVQWSDLMIRITRLVRRLQDDEQAATATEYLILLILIACFIIVVVKKYGEVTENKYADATNGVARLVTF